MLRYIVSRILSAILTIWMVVTITFFLMNFIPGNPFASENMTPITFENISRYYKLDKPLFVQYLYYLKSVLTFDFGPSMTSATIDANYYITKAFPVSIQLGLQALIVSLCVGLFLGIVSALNYNNLLDYISIVVVIAGVSVPSFVMARILTLIFSQELGWLPVSRWGTPLHTILPTLALSALPTAQIARLMRSSMLEVLEQDYIKTAFAKGLNKNEIIIKHVLKNSILPVVSALGSVITALLTGSFVIEKIFAIPGMGEAFINSILNRDYPIIMASTLVYCTVLIVVNLIIDLLYPLIDPKIKLGGSSIE